MTPEQRREKWSRILEIYRSQADFSISVHGEAAGWAMFAMSILSDAQEAMARRDFENANEWINEAKAILAKGVIDVASKRKAGGNPREMIGRVVYQQLPGDSRPFWYVIMPPSRSTAPIRAAISKWHTERRALEWWRSLQKTWHNPRRRR